jgi:prevent-host-death family protein
MTNLGKHQARKLSAAQAKSQLAACLRKAENGEPVIITRHGKAVAALVGMDGVALLSRRDTRAGAGLASLVGGWKGSEDLVRVLTKVRRTRPRRPIPLD